MCGRSRGPLRAEGRRGRGAGAVARAQLRAPHSLACPGPVSPSCTVSYGKSVLSVPVTYDVTRVMITCPLHTPAHDKGVCVLHIRPYTSGTRVSLTHDFL